MSVDRAVICHNACVMGEAGRYQRRRLLVPTEEPYSCRASRFVRVDNVRLEDRFTCNGMIRVSKRISLPVMRQVEGVTCLS